MDNFDFSHSKRKWRAGGLRRLLLIVLAIICLIPGAEAKKKTRITSSRMPREAGAPDFAFPKTVIANAEKNLRNAAAAGNGADIVEAAIQIVIANTQISQVSAPAMAKFLDSIAATQPQPWQGALYSLEAQLYQQYYQNSAWQFNSRNVPLTSVPDDPAEWSRDLFALKVMELVQHSIESPTLRQIPTSDIRKILDEGSGDYALYYPAVFDILAYRGLNLLNSFRGSGEIPFGRATGKRSVNTKVADCRVEILRSVADAARASGNKAALAVAIRAQARAASQAQDSRKILHSGISEIGDTEYSVLLWSSLFTYLEASSQAHRDYYNSITEVLKRYPDYAYINSLKDIEAGMSAPDASASRSSRVLSTDSISVEYSCSNLERVNLLLVKCNGLSASAGFAKFSDIMGSGKVVDCQTVEVDSVVPFSANRLVKFAPQPYGDYVVLASKTKGLDGVYRPGRDSYTYNLIRVSDLQLLNSYSIKDGDSGRIYVVDARNQKPIEGASVKLETRSQGRTTTRTLTSNSEGFVECDMGSVSVTATYGKDRIYNQFWGYADRSDSGEELYASILTDLSVYHPGDSVQFSVVGYKEHNRKFSPLAEKDLALVLNNANGVACDTLNLRTDRYGRVAGVFQLPNDGLLGAYSITARTDNKYLSSTYVQVAEYKAPTFFVEIDSVAGEVSIGDVVRVKGHAATYSGMPLADASVDYKVTYQPLWWRSSAPADSSYADSVTTDSAGEFLIELPTEALRNTPYAYGIYSLSATVTSQAGETQQSPARRFALGKSYSISPELPAMIDLQAPDRNYKVNVNDILGEPASVTVNYTIRSAKDNKIMAQGIFTSPHFNYDFTKLQPGQYDLEFEIDGYQESDTDSKVVIYDSKSSRPPYQAILWVPKSEYYSDGSSVKVTVGSGYSDSWLLCELADTDKIIWRKWIRLNDENTSIDVPAPAADSRYWLNVRGLRDLQCESANIRILPAEAAKRLKITVNSFRDKLVPGESESWSFGVKYADTPCAQVPVIAVLNNKALSAIVPFNWWLSPSMSWISALHTNEAWVGNSYFGFPLGTAKKYPTKTLVYPDINTYGYGLAGGVNYNNIRIRGAMYKSSAVTFAQAESDAMVEEVQAEPLMASGVANTSAKKEMGVVLTEDDVANGSEAGGGVATTAAPEPLRPSELPLAFFKPGLTTDNEGNVAINFRVPDFNTTWSLKLLSYDDSMHTDILTLEAVASKPVMVSSNAPRFLRTDDNAVIQATIMNNTDSVRSTGARLEIFDPYTDRVLRSKEFESSPLGAKGSRVVSIDYAVPGDVEAVAFRAYAISENYSDGEQTLIGILPSSSPVVESESFYLDPQESTRIVLPDYPEDARLTLQYCDNPVWYCMTALPDISTPESENLSAMIYALYGNAMTRGLIKRYPQIREALEYWRINPADSMLVSGLERNADLKALTLNNTPWVNNAASETLRMERIAALASGAADDKTVNSLISRIAALQNHDGGWSWCKGMESSVFMTESMLDVCGMLAQAGMLPQNPKLLEMLKKGANFYEKQMVAEYNRDRKNFNPEIVTDYLLAASYLGIDGGAYGFATIRNKAIAAVKNNWKEYSIPATARAALLLNKKGYPMVSRTILESLRQRSMNKKGRGVWYDNLYSGFDGSSRVYATSLVLRAFAEIAPGDSLMINGLRQWLLTEREVEDWGAMRYTADAVQAIISSGADWCVDPSPTLFALNGAEITVPAKNYTGEFKIQLDPKEASGASLTIDRSGATPSWGAVIAQYIKPMEDVKSASTDDLRIEKMVLVVEDTPDGTVLSEKSPTVGDKVRIQLVITSGRDLDYVAVTDERGAFMEPADQISSYTSADGLWFYRETCNSATNFFMNFLPKGTHVIWYDCYASHSGEYAVGIAQAQSYYAPSVVAHSAGAEIVVAPAR